jgi:hypothetical protein
MARMPKPSPPSDLNGSTFETSLNSIVLPSNGARPGGKGSSLAKGDGYGKIGVCLLASTVFYSLYVFRSPGPLISYVFAVDIAKAVDPKVLSTLASPVVPKEDGDDVSARPEKIYLVNYDTSKAKKIFGIKYRTEKDCATDMIADFGKRGW